MTVEGRIDAKEPTGVDIFDDTDLADLRGEHICCDYTCTFDGTMRRAAAEIEQLRADKQRGRAAAAFWKATARRFAQARRAALNIQERASE